MKMGLTNYGGRSGVAMRKREKLSHTGTSIGEIETEQVDLVLFMQQTSLSTNYILGTLLRS